MTDFVDFHTLPSGRHETALEFGRAPDGTPLRVPLTILVGPTAGPRVVVTAGVHGDEYEGIRAVVKLCQELDHRQLHGSVVLVPVANPPAFNSVMRVSPLDGVNLNRVFPGNATGTVTERLAYLLFRQVITQADFLVDLHSGGTRYLFHPQAGFYRMPGQVGERSFGMAQAFDLDWLWEMPGRAGVFSHEAMRAGVCAIGCEIGGNGRCEPAHVAIAIRGVRRVLHYAGVLPQDTGEPPPPPKSIWSGDFALSPASGLFEPAVTLNQEVAAGQLLYTIHGLDGSIVHQRHAEHAGLISAIRIFGMIQQGEWDVSLLQRAD